MDNQGESDERIKRLILTLRDITLAVQIAPFVISLLYILGITAQLLFSGDTSWLFSIILYTPPPIILIMLIFSRMLHLCKWHRLACALPVVFSSMASGVQPVTTLDGTAVAVDDIGGTGIYLAYYEASTGTLQLLTGLA